MPIKLFDNGIHSVCVYTDLVEGSGIQSNQILVMHDGRGAIFDPGGELTYTPLSIMLSRLFSLDQLDLIFASHQDPDIIASLPRWMSHTNAKVIVSKLWQRFLPHLSSSFSQKNSGDLLARIQSLPDSGGKIPLSETEIYALPAHFMHSSGNFSFYDPVSKILFSGDIGSSFGSVASEAVTNFEQHINYMTGFHQRYISSAKASKYWVASMRSLDIQMIVPQHGSRIEGKENVEKFFTWLEHLPCGLDLVDAKFYQMKNVLVEL